MIGAGSTTGYVNAQFWSTNLHHTARPKKYVSLPFHREEVDQVIRLKIALDVECDADSVTRLTLPVHICLDSTSGARARWHTGDIQVVVVLAEDPVLTVQVAKLNVLELSDRPAAAGDRVMVPLANSAGKRSGKAFGGEDASR